MRDRVSVTPKILELNDSNDIYMTMDIVILSNDVNYNKAQFTDDFIEGVVDNKEKYIGLPFLVNREKLENGEFDNLTHEFDEETGELKTDQIGSFVDYWSEEVDGANCLMGSIRIFKRFTETTAKIIELYEEDKLETSCEVLVESYESVDNNVRTIHYNNGNNALIGSAIVTNAAEYRAKPTLLVAEAYEKDLQNLKALTKEESKGGETVENSREYNNGVKVRYNGELEVSGVTFDEIEKQLYNLLNPVDPVTEERAYRYYIFDIYPDLVVVYDYTNEKHLAAKYTIENGVIHLSDNSEWVTGSYQFVPDGYNVFDLISLNSKEIKDKEAELQALRKENEQNMEELKKEIASLKEELAELTEKNEGFQEEIAKLEETIVSQKEALVEAEEKEASLNQQIEELSVYKEKVETAEKEAKRNELVEKFSKLLDAEVFESEEVVEALDNLDETTLNSIVVDQIAKKQEVEMNKKKDGVVVNAKKLEDLVPQNKGASFWSAPRK